MFGNSEKCMTIHFMYYSVKNKSLTAIKHGFIATMPILLVGAFAVLLNSVILDWGEGSLWQSLGITISQPAIDQLASFQAIGNFVIQVPLNSLMQRFHHKKTIISYILM